MITHLPVINNDMNQDTKTATFLLPTTNNNNDDFNNNNNGYVEKILNKDKENLNKRYYVNSNSHSRTSQNDKHHITIDGGDNDENSNKLDENLLKRNFKHTRRKRDDTIYGMVRQRLQVNFFSNLFYPIRKLHCVR